MEGKQCTNNTNMPAPTQCKHVSQGMKKLCLHLKVSCEMNITAEARLQNVCVCTYVCVCTMVVQKVLSLTKKEELNIFVVVTLPPFIKLKKYKFLF